MNKKKIYEKRIALFIIVMFIGANVSQTNSGFFGNFNKLKYVNSTVSNQLHSNLLNGGWLKEINGVKICHINGSHYQMGYQYGFLLKEQIHQNFRAWTNIPGCSIEGILAEWEKIKGFVPCTYKEEIKGIANGSDLSVNKIMAAFMLGYKHESLKCCGMVATGSATSDGKLYHLRSLDSFTRFFKDPKTDIYGHENQIVLIREPELGYASISPSIVGDIGCLGGINENGLGISYVSGYSCERGYNGIPNWVKIKTILDYSSNINEALDIVASNGTDPWAVLISDGKKAESFVIEQTANLTYVGTWDNPVESTNPFWKIDDVIRRTNIFINTSLAATQRNFYDPSHFPLLLSLLKINPLAGKNMSASGPWMHYVALSKSIEKNFGYLNLSSAMSMLRNVYKGYTDFRFFISCWYLRIFKFHIFTWHQWVACPESGDILISFSSARNDAFKNSVHLFNLFELLKNNN